MTDENKLKSMQRRFRHSDKRDVLILLRKSEERIVKLVNLVEYLHRHGDLRTVEIINNVREDLLE